MNKNVGDGLRSRSRTHAPTRTGTKPLDSTLDQTVSPTFLVHLGVGRCHYNHSDSTPQSVLDYNTSGLLGLGGNATGFPQITGLSSTQGGFLFTNSSGPARRSTLPGADQRRRFITTITDCRWRRAPWGPANQQHYKDRLRVAAGHSGPQSEPGRHLRASLQRPCQARRPWP